MMTPTTPSRLLCEFIALVAAVGDHLDHLPARVRHLPHTRTLTDQLDHARLIVAEQDSDSDSDQEGAA